MRALVFFLFVFSSAAFAKIVVHEDKLFIRKSGKQVPIMLVNQLVDQKAITHLKLYGGGDIHLVSFAKEGEKEKLYSVDEKGFIYSIEPFTSYEIEKVHAEGFVTFKQQPLRKYRISSKGFFLY